VINIPVCELYSETGPYRFVSNIEVKHGAYSIDLLGFGLPERKNSRKAYNDCNDFHVRAMLL
jgi:hypothetical protein